MWPHVCRLSGMASTTASSRLALLVVGMLGAALAACSSASTDDAAVSGEDALVSDAASMTQRADGSWDVVCKDGRREVVTTADILADKVCGGAPPIACVQKCAARYNTGACKTPAPDFCGPAATCAKQCSERYNNGECKTYAEDFCGPASTCVTQCSERYNNGTCKTYAADLCGASDVACIAQCAERYNNGECKTYKADFCKTTAPAPTCIKVCAERYNDGSCKTYGADLCQ
jgi:hypothetical protein